MGFKGTVWHHDGGNNLPDALADGHYHWTYDNAGGEHAGDNTVEDNFNVRDGKYAAHTLSANTGRAGLAVLGMHGGSPEYRETGRYPPTVEAFDKMLWRTGKLHARFKVPIARETALSHASVQRVLGIKQRGKWDLSWLPYPDFGDGGWADSLVVDEFLRERCIRIAGGNVDAITPPDPVDEALAYLQRLLVRSGYDVGDAGADGRMGPDTSTAIREFEADVGLPVTGALLGPWRAKLRAAHEERGAAEAVLMDTLGVATIPPHVIEALRSALSHNAQVGAIIRNITGD